MAGNGSHPMPAADVLQYFVHLGAFFYLTCFLFRNQIALRGFAILGDMAYMAYYYGASTQPLWNAIFWGATNVLINCLMIWLLVRDQRMSLFSDDEMRLYQNLKGINPGQFRRLLRLATWKRVAEPTVLTEEGRPLTMLHYVLDGTVEIEKSGRPFSIKPAVFIGELAYLRQKPATATVRVGPGALCLSWRHVDLLRLSSKDDGIRVAMLSLLNSDLAEKVVNA
jgi:hypothetical protein